MMSFRIDKSNVILTYAVSTKMILEFYFFSFKKYKKTEKFFFLMWKIIWQYVLRHTPIFTQKRNYMISGIR